MKKRVEKGTIIRTCVLLLALLNQILAASGKSPLPIDSEELTNIISTGFTVVTAIIAWWKNNDFTNEAMNGTMYMRRLKNEKKANL